MSSSYSLDLVLVALSAIVAFFVSRGNREGRTWLGRTVAIAVPVSLVIYSQTLWASTGLGVIDHLTCAIVKEAKACTVGWSDQRSLTSSDDKPADAADNISDARKAIESMYGGEQSPLLRANGETAEDGTAQPIVGGDIQLPDDTMLSDALGFSERTPPLRKYVRYKVERSSSSLLDPSSIIVWGEIDGARHKITEIEDWAGEVAVTADFNQDGTLDAIISQHGGGNCCPSQYRFVLYLQNDEFVVSELLDVYSWEGPKLEWVDQRWLVKFVSHNEGMNYDDFEETISYFTVEGTTVKLVSSHKTAELPALTEIRSKQYETDGTEPLNLTYDIDGDGSADTISCEIWERWGRLSSCKVFATSRRDAISVQSSCKRIGVLATSHNGMRNLVCDANDRLQFDPASNSYVTLGDI